MNLAARFMKYDFRNKRPFDPRSIFFSIDLKQMIFLIIRGEMYFRNFYLQGGTLLSL